jgi:hypothetical protein
LEIFQLKTITKQITRSYFLAFKNHCSIITPKTNILQDIEINSKYDMMSDVIYKKPLSGFVNSTPTHIIHTYIHITYMFSYPKDFFMILQTLLQCHTTSNQVICQILPSSHTHHRPQSYSRSWQRWSYDGNTSHN